jgi:hypothetical protein
VIDSASSSLVATMAASDVAASDATPMATTSDALRRDDTGRRSPAERRTGGGPATIGILVATLEQFEPIAPQRTAPRAPNLAGGGGGQA